MHALNKDTTKWCAFHKDIGYDTKNYRHLKKEIDELLLKGYLGNLVVNDNQINEIKKNRNFPRIAATPIER